MPVLIFNCFELNGAIHDNTRPKAISMPAVRKNITSEFSILASQTLTQHIWSAL